MKKQGWAPFAFLLFAYCFFPEGLLYFCGHHDSVAQPAEQLTLNQRVESSSLSGVTPSRRFL